MKNVRNVDLSELKPWRLEYLCQSESRMIFNDGPNKLVPAENGLVQIHLRFPNGEPFTAHVTREVFEKYFVPLYPLPFKGPDSVLRTCPECGLDAVRWKIVRARPLPLPPDEFHTFFEARCADCDFRDKGSGRVLNSDELGVLEVMES